MPQHHSTPPRGLELAPRSVLIAGRFGRMFRNLPGLEPSEGALKKLAGDMLEPPEKDDNGGDQPPPEPPPYPDGGADHGPDFDNPAIPAGYTYLGQFIDHDITFDPMSELQKRNDPDALVDFRTPRFDLDSLYGSGPSDDPFLYESDRPGTRGVELLVGVNPQDE